MATTDGTVVEIPDAGEPGEAATASESRALEVVAAVVALAFNVALLLLATGIDLRREPAPGQIDARMWPSVLAIAGIVLATARLAIALFRPPDNRDDLEPIRSGGRRRLLVTLALTVAYTGLWSLRESIAHGFPAVVFLILTPFFLAALVLLYGGRGWKAWLLYPVATTAGAYLLFGYLLRIPL